MAYTYKRLVITKDMMSRIQWRYDSGYEIEAYLSADRYRSPMSYDDIVVEWNKRRFLVRVSEIEVRDHGWYVTFLEQLAKGGT